MAALSKHLGNSKPSRHIVKHKSTLIISTRKTFIQARRQYRLLGIPKLFRKYIFLCSLIDRIVMMEHPLVELEHCSVELTYLRQSEEMDNSTRSFSPPARSPHSPSEQKRSGVHEGGHQSVVAIQDASKDIDLIALREALEISELKPGDMLTILGLIQIRSTPSKKKMGSHGRPYGADQNSQTERNMNTLIDEEIQRCKEKLDRNKDFMLICIVCEQKQIVLQIEFSLGHQNKALLLDAVKFYQPTILILDRHMKHKKFFMDNLKCCICRVRHHNTIEILRGLPKLKYEEMLGPEISYNFTTFKSQHEFLSFCCNGTKDNQMDVETSMVSTNYGEASSSTTYECLKRKCPSSLKFGREPKLFDYSEIEAATEKFSSENFLFEGGFGLVYRGRLQDGQYIAVKKKKREREKEFSFEVELLSYAQHKNFVNLLGYCGEDDQQLLVYEYFCNGSLDEHLHKSGKPLPWNYRQKIAEGTAKGLRYLHEEYRESSIVHRDVRPKNILLTQDFEPKIFGLATSQKTSEVDNQTRVVGTFGYLAPEYAESGKVSTKTDVYSFGMVLLELITGRNPLDRTCPGQSLIAWARPFLEYKRYHDLVDPLIMDSHDVYGLYCMVRAASLCLRKDPDSRPSMSQVLQILEGSMMNQLHEDFLTMKYTQSNAKKKHFVSYDEMIQV